MENFTNRMDRLSIAEIRTLGDIVPICANCRRIRDVEGFWKRVEAYVAIHIKGQFSHSICPDCRKRLYAEFLKN